MNAKISVVTVCFNSVGTVGETIASVNAQNYGNIEHVVVDGASSDGTQALVQSTIRPGGIFVSERDRGIYDAINKGIRLATGDVIGLLNSDDIYADPDVLARVAAIFEADPTLDAVLGDTAFFDDLAPDRIVRRYESKRFRPSRVAWGWMPAHPAMFLTRAAYERAGLYRTDYRIAGDFEFVARAFVRFELRYVHSPDVFVKMRLGGVSTSGLKSTWTINQESVRACRENGIYSNLMMILSKYPLKLKEYFR